MTFTTATCRYDTKTAPPASSFRLSEGRFLPPQVQDPLFFEPPKRPVDHGAGGSTGTVCPSREPATSVIRRDRIMDILLRAFGAYLASSSPDKKPDCDT